MMRKEILLQALVVGIANLAEKRQQESQMNSRDFMYWLRGHLEGNSSSGLTSSRVQLINQHLALAIQTEANAKQLAEDQDRARIAKVLHEAGRDDLVSHMQHRGPAAGC